MSDREERLEGTLFDNEKVSVLLDSETELETIFSHRAKESEVILSNREEVSERSSSEKGSDTILSHSGEGSEVTLPDCESRSEARLSSGEKESMSMSSSRETRSDATLSSSEKKFDAHKADAQSASVLDNTGHGTPEATDTSEEIPQHVKKIPDTVEVMADSGEITIEPRENISDTGKLEQLLVNLLTVPMPDGLDSLLVRSSAVIMKPPLVPREELMERAFIATKSTVTGSLGYNHWTTRKSPRFTVTLVSDARLM